ncbi:MAG: RNA polymerase sigma-70 factor [Prevotellaceae bacterium]|nr:RNA polymerase sigma-70 factor [Prevotellaceae bacterium]
MKNNHNIELLKRLKYDDESALKDLYMAYYEPLFRFAMHFTKSEMIAEEIVSDVFFNLWQNRNRTPEVNNLDTYLYKAVKNKAIHYIDKANRRPQNEELSIAVEYVSDEDNPENIIIKEEIDSLLTGVVESLPAKCRLIFKLACEDRLKYKEIAKILNISVKTIDAQLRIAKQKLRKLI